MTDHSRGAYAPHHDAPLAFDTFDARGRSGRRPMPMTLIGSAVVLLVLVTALVMFYRSGVRGAGGPPRPIGEAAGAIKTAPGAAAQPSDAGEGLAVYSPQNVPTAAAPAPTFAPQPEQPLARRAPAAASPAPAPAPAHGLQVETAPLHAMPAPAPAPKPAPVVVAKASPAKPVAVAKLVPAVASSDDADVAPVAAKPAKVETVPAKAPAALAAKASAKSDAGLITTTLGAKPRAAKTEVAKAEPAKPAPVKTEEAPVAEKPAAKVELAAAPAHGVLVQIGAFSSTAQVDKGWASASSAASAKMAGKGRRVEKLEKDGKTLYRTSVTGFASHTDAAAFCAKLSAKGLACMVKG